MEAVCLVEPLDKPALLWRIHKCRTLYRSYLEKIAKTTATKEIILADEAVFPFDFWLILAILRSFFCHFASF